MLLNCLPFLSQVLFFFSFPLPVPPSPFLYFSISPSCPITPSPAHPFPYLVARHAEPASVDPCTIDTSSDRMSRKRTGRGEGNR